MNVELREFPPGTQVTKAGITGGDPSQARRSHILIDGRWVGHVGWDDGEQVVLCVPTTEEERNAVQQMCVTEFGGPCETILAQPAVEEPRDRRSGRRRKARAEEDSE